MRKKRKEEERKERKERKRGRRRMRSNKRIRRRIEERSPIKWLYNLRRCGKKPCMEMYVV